MFSAPHALFKYGLLVVYNDLCGRGSDVLRLRSAPTDAHLKCFIILFCKLGAAIRCLFISVLIFAKLKKTKIYIQALHIRHYSDTVSLYISWNCVREHKTRLNRELVI